MLFFPPYGIHHYPSVSKTLKTLKPNYLSMEPCRHQEIVPRWTFKRYSQNKYPRHRGCCQCLSFKGNSNTYVPSTFPANHSARKFTEYLRRSHSRHPSKYHGYIVITHYQLPPRIYVQCEGWFLQHNYLISQLLQNLFFWIKTGQLFLSCFCLSHVVLYPQFALILSLDVCFLLPEESMEFMGTSLPYS